MALRKTRGRALVTGGSGFVGRYVVDELSRRDYYVGVIDSLPTDSDADWYRQVSMLDYEDLLLAVSEFCPTHVVHLAAIHYIPYCNLHPTETYMVNVVGTHNLLDVLDEVSPKKLFVASSAAVYTPSIEPHKESDPAWPNDIYGFTKVAMEFATTAFSEKTCIPSVIGRYFNMYGWGETTPHLIPAIMEQLDTALAGEPIKLGNLDTRRDFVHVRDNSRATVDLLEMDLEGVTTINLGSGTSYSARDIVDALSAVIGIEIPISLDRQRIRRSDRSNLQADMVRFDELGLERPYTSLKDGLKELVAIGIGPYLRDPLGEK